MQATKPWTDAWSVVKQANQTQRLFALIDPAQDPTLLNALARSGRSNACLFGYEIHSPIAKSTPRLIELGEEPGGEFLDHFLQRVPLNAGGTLFASDHDLQSLHQHLSTVADVNLDGIDSMFLAYWDPAILGTLLGQEDDLTLHVPGPVLDTAQRRAFFGPIQTWWYWDRSGQLHEAQTPDKPLASESPEDLKLLPLQLNEDQTEMLVEASVPDHLLSHIQANQPELLEGAPRQIRYNFVRQQLARARSHGLVGMGDLVNYVCIALLYGPTFDEAANMPSLLARVRSGAIKFEDALVQADEPALVESTTPVALLTSDV
jgi:Domain of unknown function (DUF4123)